jgi:cupin 2 domain-containing protein
VEKGNIFHHESWDLLKEEIEEITEPLWEGRGVKVERILSSGQISPPGFWYDQEEDEWVALLEGRAEIEYADGSRTEMNEGDWLLIPAHRRHRVAYTSRRCVWLAVFAGAEKK